MSWNKKPVESMTSKALEREKKHAENRADDKTQTARSRAVGVRRLSEVESEQSRRKNDPN